ncbi:nucleotidyltransferase family protein [Bacillus suaedae]|uniref:Nucleotidyltransferase family protein n=1 Tax=Halalkalibacter suaedae TaxID=2822140 RepID=A0A940WS63_9BACI|nr:nucleotidyltransferase family protein [Bacillus suaedae]MBP3951500.1 nucleotidyltransferase family protein [Bacillus suaedae]
MDNTFKLDRIPKELKLIFALLEDRTPSIGIDIDWELFQTLSIHHRVFPLLHAKVKQVADRFPVRLLQWFERRYKQNTFKMLRLSAEMECISNLFLAQNIKTLFLKGPVLAQDLYGDLSLRTSSDLDFLIPIEHLPQAEELLVCEGYEKDDYIETVLNDWRWRHHHVTYVHPEKGIKVEIHWRLHPGPGKEPRFHELWERRKKSVLTSSPVYLLGREDLFVFLVAHGARHGWSRLRWLVDIRQMMEMEMDWKRVCQLFFTYHHPHLGGQAIRLASCLLDAKVTGEMNPLLTKRSVKLANQAIFYLEDMINLHTDPVPKDVSSYHARHLFALMSFNQKVLHVLCLLHPLPEDTDTLPLPKSLHFLYFPLRPLLWGWRKTRKNEISRGLS